MKNSYSRKLALLPAIIFAVVALFTSCEGEIGPAGADGNAVCLQCHNLATDSIIEAAYEESGHAAGGAVAYAGRRNDCAMCHSHEGALETLHTGRDTTAENVAIPTPISCETCHSFHKTLDMANEGPDYAIRINEPVDLLMDTVTILDLGDNSNLCARCHQPRRAGPVADGNGEARVTPHYGPHHGPQSTILKGIGAYGVPDGSSAHLGADATCITCHMHEDANGVAGHSWEVSAASCTGCHEGATDFDINGVQTEIAGLMETLKGKLIADGLLAEDPEHAGEYHAVEGSYPVDKTGAVYNYILVLDDRSDGVHNYEYTKALLEASIAVFN